MTLDTQLHDSFTSAVDDTTVPPGLARAAMAGGRARKRRRRLAAGALAVAAIVGGGALTQLPTSPAAHEGQVADGGTEAYDAALRWARSLPEGAAPDLPFFGRGGLWAAGQVVTVPDSVNRTVPPREVAGGWLVMVGQDEAALAWAVLAGDGTLRQLPAETSADGLGDARAKVSADGSQVATGDWLVELATMEATVLPHAPAANEADGYGTAIRIVGFTDAGLIYEGAPFEQGMGATWLLRPDGSTERMDPPDGSHISDGGPADVAVGLDYAADNSDTCVTTWLLHDALWEEWKTGCMGQYLGEAVAISPEVDWLLTDDLPRIWDLTDGEWSRVDVPTDVVALWKDAWLGRAVWEDADSFLLPVADRTTGLTSPADPFAQNVQVVRCTVSAGTCERAGDEQQVTVTSTMWGATEVAFAS